MKLKIKADVLEKQVEKYKVLLDCWKTEKKYSDELYQKANYEKSYLSQ